MYSAKNPITAQPRNLLMSWEFIFLKILLLAVVGIQLEKPMGSLAGRIALEREGFGLYSYNIRENKVYALAIGPRKGPQIERGVWINNDGSFRIDQLPVGEYELKLRATGYGTEYINGLFIEEGKVNVLDDAVAMHLVEPSVSIGSNMRVFTTKEQPYLWANASGASKVKIKVYRSDLIQLAQHNQLKAWGYELGSSLD
ncbi:MAG TPA: carboxypeptidase-like regulatory domain-containing protein, partial [Candidatus Obscuribacterales bacterium]